MSQIHFNCPLSFVTCNLLTLRVSHFKINSCSFSPNLGPPLVTIQEVICAVGATHTCPWWATEVADIYTAGWELHCLRKRQTQAHVLLLCSRLPREVSMLSQPPKLPEACSPLTIQALPFTHCCSFPERWTHIHAGRMWPVALDMHKDTGVPRPCLLALSSHPLGAAVTRDNRLCHPLYHAVSPLSPTLCAVECLPPFPNYPCATKKEGREMGQATEIGSQEAEAAVGRRGHVLQAPCVKSTSILGRVCFVLFFTFFL